MLGTWKSTWNIITIKPNIAYQDTNLVETIEHYTEDIMIVHRFAGASWNPLTYSKRHFFADGAKFKTCDAIYGQATATAALVYDTSSVFDASAANGCGESNFAHTEWTALVNPLLGSWTVDSPADTLVVGADWTETISSVTTAYTIEHYTETIALMQNPGSGHAHPSKWTKVQFFADGANFKYCMTVTDGATATAALTQDTTSVYDTASATGCNGAAFKVMTAASA
jgi:hypothetical protein